MKVILAIVFWLFVAAGAVPLLVGVLYLLMPPENVFQQQAQGTLATAYFVLTLICWLIAYAAGKVTVE